MNTLYYKIITCCSKHTGRLKLTHALVLNNNKVEFLWGDKAIKLDAETDDNHKKRKQEE